MTPVARRLTAYAVSTAVGSGKTKTAIEYMARPDNSNQNFIYVAPTIRLIGQTADHLIAAMEESESTREVALIHSQKPGSDGLPVAAQSTLTINDAGPDDGLVVIVTTVTFLNIITRIKAPQHWRVILDEAFAPVQFVPFQLGKRAEAGWDYFQDVLFIGPPPAYRVVPAVGESSWVEQLASGNAVGAGEQYKPFQPLAAIVTNSALRCELVLTDKAKQMMERAKTAASDKQLEVTSADAEAVLLFACYVTPDPFVGFDEVIFMSALFEHTLLYRLWTTLFDVTFIPHAEFPTTKLRNIHTEQGPLVAVGHLLHADDSSSRYNLERNTQTGDIGEREEGSRVIDQLVNLSAEYFKDSTFLLQTNNGYGYELGSSLIPSNAKRVPAASHGLNEFQDHDNVAALAVTNPTPQEAAWIMSRTGLTRTETNMAYRIHTTYQAVGRSSIRKANPTSNRKVFLTAGQVDAWMLHVIFEGSKWLGQVGDMRSLRRMSMASMPDTMEVQLADQITKRLDELPETTAKMSSRAIKAAMNPTCATSTWTRAVGLASEESDDWALVGQSFVRRDAAYYGFTMEEGFVVEDLIST
ncbi:MAG: DEAD/DEAH box helicase family protein [Methylibium sp.]|uniref:DEAD/DEAH box helicase family protein n=1 Tax=Methylibium sp. TaxID=2067992 RepID=UPI00182192FB|nr:DEAD/DEAH box helicase family protein [Methylibium sp.]MBA3596223.1 DEAD/DEAH box helicase family protein [Methylibium sp.]